MKIAPDSLALALATGLAMALLHGCAAGSPSYAEPEYTPVQPASVQGAAASGAPLSAEAIARNPEKGAIEVTGVWQGQSWAECGSLIPDPSRCGAVNDITFTLLQKDAGVSGFYRCGYGNMDCRNQNETGKIAQGTMGARLLEMRVMMPDGSDCLFNGQPRGDAIEGGYMCLQGGGMVERGIWRARRNY